MHLQTGLCYHKQSITKTHRRKLLHCPSRAAAFWRPGARWSLQGNVWNGVEPVRATVRAWRCLPYVRKAQAALLAYKLESLRRGQGNQFAQTAAHSSAGGPAIRVCRHSPRNTWVCAHTVASLLLEVCCMATWRGGGRVSGEGERAASRRRRSRACGTPAALLWRYVRASVQIPGAPAPPGRNAQSRAHQRALPEDHLARRDVGHSKDACMHAACAWACREEQLWRMTPLRLRWTHARMHACPRPTLAPARARILHAHVLACNLRARDHHLLWRALAVSIWVRPCTHACMHARTHANTRACMHVSTHT